MFIFPKDKSKIDPTSTEVGFFRQDIFYGLNFSIITTINSLQYSLCLIHQLTLGFQFQILAYPSTSHLFIEVYFSS